MPVRTQEVRNRDYFGKSICCLVYVYLALRLRACLRHRSLLGPAVTYWQAAASSPVEARLVREIGTLVQAVESCRHTTTASPFSSILIRRHPPHHSRSPLTTVSASAACCVYIDACTSQPLTRRTRNVHSGNFSSIYRPRTSSKTVLPPAHHGPEQAPPDPSPFPMHALCFFGERGWLFGVAPDRARTSHPLAYINPHVADISFLRPKATAISSPSRHTPPRTPACIGTARGQHLSARGRGGRVSRSLLWLR